MQIEYIARIGFSSRRSFEQQRHCAISDRVLGKIIVNDQYVLALIHKMLRHRAACVWRDVLQRRHIAGGCGNDDGVLHRLTLFQRLHQLRDGGFFLSDRDVNTNNIFSLLVENGVDGDRGFAGLTVSDNELSLPLADWHHRINRFDSGLQRFIDRFTHQHAGRAVLDGTFFSGNNRPFAVNRLSKRV